VFYVSQNKSIKRHKKDRIAQMRVIVLVGWSFWLCARHMTGHYNQTLNEILSVPLISIRSLDWIVPLGWLSRAPYRKHTFSSQYWERFDWRKWNSIPQGSRPL